MTTEIELVASNDGLAVIGDKKAVAKFLHEHGLAGLATPISSRSTRRLVSLGSSVARTASEVAEQSAQWVKLTPESAELRQKYGLMKSKKDGVSHAMIGKPGDVKRWLQVDEGPAALASNPAALAGAGGVMAQVALEQAVAEIIDYLERIDAKVDEVLRKQDDQVVAQMVGVGAAVARVETIRQETGDVDDDEWSTIDQAHQIIGATQAYALAQLEAVAVAFESRKLGKLVTQSAQAEVGVPMWLSVIARCEQLQESVDIIELDRALASNSIERIERKRRGVAKAQVDRRAAIGTHTASLLDRISSAVEMANAKLVFNHTKAVGVIASANVLAVEVAEAHAVLHIDAERRVWAERSLEGLAGLSAAAVQKTKDVTPIVGAGVALVGLGLVGIKQLEDGDEHRS